MIFILFAFALSNENETQQVNVNNTTEQNTDSSNRSFRIQLFLILSIFIIIILAIKFGEQGIHQQIFSLQKTLQEFAQKNFEKDLSPPRKYGMHEYEFSIPVGKNGIFEIIIGVRFSPRCDPFHLLFSKRNAILTLEFAVLPRYKSSSMIHISKERPFFLNDFRLIDKEILNGYISYSDVSKEISDINSAFKEFVNEKPDVLNYFEMSDMNRFQTKQKIRFVSYSQYEIQSSIIDPNLVIELLTFALKITNLYINKQFSEQIVEKNKQRRDKLIEIAKERQKRYEQLAKAKAEGKRKGMLNQVREMAQAQVEQQQQKKHEKTE